MPSNPVERETATMSVTLSLTNATATSGNVSIQLTGHTGAYKVMQSNPLAVSGSFTFTSLSITASTLAFNVASGASFTGNITVNIDPADGKTPSMVVNNLTADTVMVTWPTEDGPETQQLTPGTPMVLSGFVTGGN